MNANEVTRPKRTPIWAQMTLGGFFAVVGVDSVWDMVDRAREAEEATIYTADQMRLLMKHRERIEMEVLSRLKAIEDRLDSMEK